MRAPLRATALALLGLACFAATAGFGQGGYQLPTKPLLDIVDAPTTPQVSLSPDQRFLLLLEVPGLPPIAELAERELRLAGVRIKPQSNGPSRAASYRGLSLLRLADGDIRPVTGLPQTVRIDNVVWSPDGEQVAFTVTSDDRIEPWVLEVTSASARRVAAVALNLTSRTPPTWLAGSRELVALAVLENRGPEPAEPRVPSGPVIEESSGRKAPGRTYQDLLEDEHDQALFDHYFRSQVVRIGLDGTVTQIGAPGVIWDLEASPSGEWLLVHTVHRPYSYRVPAFRFPRAIEVWDRSGRVAHRLADLPLQEEVPVTFDSVPTGPRNVQWRADVPATLAWVEALDGGDARAEAADRDRVFALAAPFSAKPRELATLALRFDGITWGDDDLALVSESWWQTRRLRTWRLRPGRSTPGGAELDLIVDRSSEDRYRDPGDPETRLNEAGRRVLLTDPQGRLLLAGDGASPAGDRPFLDAYDPATKKSTRLFESEAPFFERPIELLGTPTGGAPARTSTDSAARWLLTRRESVAEPPNYFVRDLQGGSLR